VREAEQRLSQARSRLENLKKGRRPPEIASLEAQLKSARATLELSVMELERRTRLRADNVISAEELDTYQARRNTDQERVKSLEADLETARLSAREDEVKAGEAEAGAAQAALEKAQWALGQKRQTAPTDALVQDTLYREGEYVAAGNPVVSLLPPSNIKARFFVPQPVLGLVKIGAPVQVSLDGVASPLTARIDYVSPRAEFTPPVIYSKENRSKLVFMVEAGFEPAEARDLKPGQPADVRLKP
jgi:HlyD family secretion protein